MMAVTAPTGSCWGATTVYHCVMPPLLRWRADFPPVTDALLAAATSAAARLVYADDTWMYGRVTGPMTEDLPHRPVSDKGVLRAWLAERVLAAHSSGQVATVIGRAPELYGPTVESLLGRNLFGPTVEKGRVLWVGDLDQPLGRTLGWADALREAGIEGPNTGRGSKV